MPIRARERYTIYMTMALLPILVIVLFIVGVVSPHMAGKIQRKADNKAGWLKRCADWFWDPITWWAQNSIETTRKVIKKVTEWGKKTRKKIN